MRLLVPPIIVGTILASQVVLAAAPVVASSAAWHGTACRTHALERGALRVIRTGGIPACDPSAKHASTSSMSSVAAGSRTGVPCPSQAELRSALRMIELRRPFACDPNATTFNVNGSSSSAGGISSSASSASSSNATDQADTTIRSQFLLLGEKSSVIGAAKIFIEEEPLDLTAVSVNVTSEVPSVQSLLVYDDDKRYLGRATLNAVSSTNRNYRLTLAPGTFQVGKREERSLYFRAQLSPFQSAGEAGHIVQISNVVVEGNGVWSSRKYTKPSPGSDTFLQFVTSRSMITKVKNGLDPSGALVAGTNELLASFTFEGRKTDSSAHIDLTGLVFQIEQTGNVTLRNVRLRTKDLFDGLPCTVTSSTVTCSAIPSLLGSLTDGPRVVQLYGDVAASGDLHASLRLTLNEPGDPQHAGSVTWSDGSTSYSWVPFDGPVASGTNWKY